MVQLRSYLDDYTSERTHTDNCLLTLLEFHGQECPITNKKGREVSWEESKLSL